MVAKEGLGRVERVIRMALDRITGVIDGRFHRVLEHTKMGDNWYDFSDPDAVVRRDGEVVSKRSRLSGW